MDAEPGGILYLQEFFSDSVNEITYRIMYVYASVKVPELFL